MQHVVIRLKDGTDVIGILLNERERGIDLKILLDILLSC